VAFIGDDQTGLVATQRYSIGSRMNDGDKDINVVQGVGSTIAKSASSGGRKVTRKGRQPLSLKFSGGHKNQHFDPLPNRLESCGNSYSCLAGTSDGLNNAAAAVGVPGFEGLLLPGVQEGVVIGCGN
jgi:hypothetical protein